MWRERDMDLGEKGVLKIFSFYWFGGIWNSLMLSYQITKKFLKFQILFKLYMQTTYFVIKHFKFSIKMN